MMDREILLRDGELKIPTRITLPDRMVPHRVVLGVHGLGGSMDDEIQQSIAEEMAFFRAACVRFDLPCHGKSPMGPGDFTLGDLWGLRPEECLALEDSPTGILSAYRAGCLPVMIPDQDQPDAETIRILYAKADSLTDVIDLLK